MKTVKPLILVFAFLLISNTTQAQFFKKLAKKAEQRIEQEAERRAEKRVNKKIDKTFDGAENKIDSNNKKPKTEESKEEINLPDTYHFEWKYTLKMEANKSDVKMHYMLKQNATYFGVVLVLDEKDTSKSSITVMDRGRNAYIALMDMQGQKIIRTTELPADNSENNIEQADNFNLVKTDTKEILGYNCQGFKTQMDDGVMHIYIAKNAPISFNRAFGNTQNIPEGLNKKLVKELENGIMLEAEFTSNKNKKHNFKTTCIELKKMKYTLDLSEYKSLKEFNNKN